jgi:hypothetical protein
LAEVVRGGQRVQVTQPGARAAAGCWRVAVAGASRAQTARRSPPRVWRRPRWSARERRRGSPDVPVESFLGGLDPQGVGVDPGQHPAQASGDRAGASSKTLGKTRASTAAQDAGLASVSSVAMIVARQESSPRRMRPG